MYFADIKVMCPECDAEFIPCNENGDVSPDKTNNYLICPEPFNCVLSGVVYKKPEDIKLEKL